MPDLIKKFFDTFGVEPRKVKICTNTNHCPRKYKLCNDDCKHWEVVRTDYPQITDRHYLDLICTLNHVMHLDLGELYTEKLKRAILEHCIEALEKVDDWEHREPSKEEFIKEIQELFKGE